MEDNISDIKSRPLTTLSQVTKQLLSSLLNSTKVLPFEGKSRDWRGIAALTGITAEEEATIFGYHDKFGRVLDLWISKEGTACTIGELLQHLITLDRYDVYEDLKESVRQQMKLRPDNQVAIPNNNICNNNVISRVDESELITEKDQLGYRHKYHAMILSADEDAVFTNELRSRLKASGFEVCSLEDIRPGAPGLFPSIPKLIAERCQRVILIYSPDFLTCKDNTFLRDFTQYYSIQTKACVMIPIVYRECDPPSYVKMYTSLSYERYRRSDTLDVFWKRLERSLDTPDLPRSIPSAPAAALPAAVGPSREPDSAHSGCKIVTINSQTDDRKDSTSSQAKKETSDADDDGRYFMSLPSVPSNNPSLTTTNVSEQISNCASTLSLLDPGVSKPNKKRSKKKIVDYFSKMIPKKSSKKKDKKNGFVCDK